MLRTRLTLLLFGLPLLALPVMGLPRTPAEIEENRTKLQEIRKDRDQFAHLQQLAQEFLTLPAKQAEQMRQLDHDLYQLPWPYRKHLKQVLKKYVAWLNQLSVEKRQQIEEAKTSEARLELIKQFREQQWIKSLPKVDRERLAELKPEARKKEIVRLKKQQFKWEVEFRLAAPHWDDLIKSKIKKNSSHFPERFADLSPDPRYFTETYLKQMVTAAQWQELVDAQGHWPWFPYLLVKLADEHPLALLSATKWPRAIKDLPEEIKQRLTKANVDLAKTLKPLEGQYPGFAAKVAELMDRKDLRPDSWPRKHQDLSLAVRTFLDQELKGMLNEADKEKLKNAEGKWPDYPNAIQDLAGKYYLTVPWHSLPPSPAKYWDKYRLKKVRPTEKGFGQPAD